MSRSGEAGVILPQDGFLRQVDDEIQSGMARTGGTLACDFEEAVPDVYILGRRPVVARTGSPP